MRLFFLLTLIVPTLLLTGLMLPGVSDSPEISPATAPSTSLPSRTSIEDCLACLAICIDTGDGTCERICGCTGLGIGSQ